MGARGRPTIETLGVILVVFVFQQFIGLVWSDTILALSTPLLARPWTLVTSVYAHDGIVHLLSNVVALAVLGPLVARRTGRLSFHAFFVTTGVLAGVAEVVIGGVLFSPRMVLGASGAVFALLGYLITGNVVSAGLLDRIAPSRLTQVAAFVTIAVLVTLATARPRAALIGHGTGLLCGLLAGRERLIDTDARTEDATRRPRSR